MFNEMNKEWKDIQIPGMLLMIMRSDNCIVIFYCLSVILQISVTKGMKTPLDYGQRE